MERVCYPTDLTDGQWQRIEPQIPPAKHIKGRKRHILTDTIGLVFAGNVQDRDGARLVLEKVRQTLPRLELIWADGGYAGELIGWVRNSCNWLLEIVGRNNSARGFDVLPRRSRCGAHLRLVLSV